MLERIGLVSRRRQGPGYYDRFKGRVLFPIFDSQGRAVGLGGRVLPQLATGDAAKYVNSPETPLFSKSNLLYGLNVARDAIRKTGTALVMEGYTDCIVAHQFGFENTVAVLGTALGREPHSAAAAFRRSDSRGAGARRRRSRARDAPTKCWNCSWPATSICAC